MTARRVVLASLLSALFLALGSAPTVFADAGTADQTSAEAQPPGPGYWLVSRSGSIFSTGGAAFHGSTGTVALNQPIVGMAATPSGNGYWTVASDGGVFAFGDAMFHGSTGATALNEPIVAMASTPTGRGYWLVASDGGVFAFGDATFRGSTGAMTLNKPIVGLTATPTGRGYTLVAADGGIFSFGDATFHGSTGAMTLNKPIVGIASTPSGNGYWLAASDGGIFSFGDASFHGSTGATALNMPIVGMAASPSGRGYWFVAADGGVFAFGDAHFFGTAGSPGTNPTIVAMAASAPTTPATVAPAAARLAITTGPSPSTGGVAFRTQPVVRILDPDGHVVSTSTAVVTLSIRTPPAGVVLTCAASSVRAVAGVVRFSGCAINRAGRYTLRAVSRGLTAAISTATVTVGAAAQLVFVQQPSSAVSLVSFTSQPQVQVWDLGGNVVTAGTTEVTLSITAPAGAILACTSANPLSTVSGIAAFTGCNIDKSGSYTLHAARATAGVSPATSSALAINAAGADHLTFSTSPSDSTGGTPFTTQPVVTVEDAAGNTVTGDASPVALAITTPSGATLTCAGTSVAANAGVATFAGCHIDVAGTYTLDATDGALTPATSGSTIISVGAATHLGFLDQPGNSTGGIAFPTQPRIAVQDAGGNSVTTATGNITLTMAPGSLPADGALTCTSGNVQPLVAGVTAEFAGCAIDRPSATTYRLLATQSGAGGFAIQSSQFVITVGPAAQLAFLASPNASTGGIAFTQQPRVAALDAGGNLAIAAAGNVSLTITQPSAPAGAALSCTTGNMRALVGGVTPAFSGCAIDRASTTTYTLVATDDDVGVLTTTSNTFAITIGPAAKLAFVTSPNDSTGGIAFPRQPRVAVQDAGGNLVISSPRSVTLNISRPSSPVGAAIACTSANPLTTSIGIATFVGCSIDLASTSTYTLEATVTGLPLATSSTFDINVGAISQIVFSRQPSLTNANGSGVLAQQPEVSIQDAGGNLVVSDNVTSVTLDISRPSTPTEATLTCTSNTVTVSAGRGTFAGCAVDLSGDYTLFADDAADGINATSDVFTIT